MKFNDLNQARFLWLICFTSTLGVFPAGKIGNTYIPLALALIFPYLVYIIISRKGYFRIIHSWSHRFLIGYLIYCGITIVFPYILEIWDRIDRFFKGFLVLFGNIGFFLAITINPSPIKVQYMVRGLLTGAILNALYGIYQYIGSFYQLPWVIPPTPINIADPLLLHRAQGFTSEPSILAALLIPSILLGLGLRGRRWVLLTLVMIVALVFTFSSGIVFLGLACLVYSFPKVFHAFSSGRIRRRGARRIVFAVISLLGMGFLAALLGGQSMLERLRDIIAGASPYAVQNQERWASILHSLELWTSYPFGVGYNMGPTMMERFGYSSNIHSLFCGILLETGLIGLFLYSMFVASSTCPLIYRGKSIVDNMLGIGGIISLFYSFATGVFLPTQIIIWGIATVVNAGYHVNFSI